VSKTQASEHHFQPSSTDLDLAVTVENTPPTLSLATTDALIREDRNSEQAIEINVEDADGILLVRADLGILKPISQTQTWVTLYDNGQGLDRVAGDGIYTATASVRSSTPLSSHEIKIQASRLDPRVSNCGTKPAAQRSRSEGRKMHDHASLSLTDVMYCLHCGQVYT
jgi:hypothetical protein